MNSPDRILILDYGSQFTQLIARRIREQRVYCEIHPPTISRAAIEAWNPAGIVLSGGPSSVLDPGAPDLDPEIVALGRPVLGICYGLQLLAHRLGGLVEKADDREYGRALFKLDRDDPLFADLPGGAERVVWMSHGDRVLRLPAGWIVLGTSENSPFAAVRHAERPIWGVQFHPEVAHTQAGTQILANFAHKICGCASGWTLEAFIADATARIRAQVGDRRAVCGLSGGVDSSVAAVLVHQAIGDRLTCVFVDNGLLREREREEVEALFREHLAIPLVTARAEDRFLDRLAGEQDPERKRRIIGHTFIEVFEEQARKLAGDGRGPVEFLVQGTLYPDVIESVSVRGPSATIKTHHNVGGLPERMNLALVEPLRELFKDEVREVGRKLGLPEALLGRHPFPGPGLAIRVITDVTRERLAILRRADAIVVEEIRRAGLYDKLWQAFAVFLPVQSVGVMGDERTYENAIAVRCVTSVDAIVVEEIRRAGLYDKLWQAFAVFLPVQSVGVMGDERTYENAIAVRCVTSVDAMTADWAPLPTEVLQVIGTRIINEVKGVNRVVYDISSKPPATIEWE